MHELYVKKLSWLLLIVIKSGELWGIKFVCLYKLTLNYEKIIDKSG